MASRKGAKRPQEAGFTVRVYPGEDGYYVATCDELPGCVSQGKTVDEVHANIKEAMVAYIETLSDLVEGERGRLKPQKAARSVRVTRFTLEQASA